MKYSEIPFNIEITKVTQELLKTMKPVSVSDLMYSTGQKFSELTSSGLDLTWQGQTNLTSNFHEEGLFSTSIFGRVGEEERYKQFSYIKTGLSVLHPAVFKALGRVNSLYLKILSGTVYAVWDKEINNFVLSDELEGSTGYSFFVKHFKDIKYKETKSQLRKDMISLISNNLDRALTEAILVLPAGLRDVRASNVGRLEFDVINDFYRKIIGLSNTLIYSSKTSDESALDSVRYRLNLSFIEPFDYLENMLKGKRGFVENKWTKRKIAYGTRSVISAIRNSKKDLDDEFALKATDTVMGMFQVMRGALPLTINALKEGYLKEVMGDDALNNKALLVDPVTLKRTLVDLNPLTKEEWSTIDGLDSVINRYEQKDLRHKPITIEDYYLALVYKDDKGNIKVFNDIDDLPEEFDKKFVKPITLIEFLYINTYPIIDRLRSTISRDPITGINSIYPSRVYMESTSVSESRTLLGEDWEVLPNKVYPSYPKSNYESYFESMSVASNRLGGLGGDFDGDMCPAILVYSLESVKEIDTLLHSRESYVSPSGGLRSTVETDTLTLVLKNMTK